MARSAHHLALLVDDLDAAETFYREVLDLDFDRAWVDEDGTRRSVWLCAGELTLMLERAAPGAQRRATDGGGLHLLAFCIEPSEREAVRARLEQSGQPVDEESDYTLYFRDPEGNRVGLSHWPQPR